MGEIVSFDIKKTVNLKQYSLPLDQVKEHCPHIDSYLGTDGKLDLGDPQALTVYNQCLFRILEGISLDLLPGHLIPTCGLRRGVVDLLMQEINPSKVIEIGTGQGVMALLFAKRGVRVIATEIDPESYEQAIQNARKNSLLPFIQFYLSSGGVLEWLKNIEGVFPVDLVFSLPPFYAEQPRSTKSRGFLGSQTELYSPNEAETFSLQIIQESLFLHPLVKTVALLWKSKESLQKLFYTLPSLRSSTSVIEFLAGTRKRYLSITSLVK